MSIPAVDARATFATQNMLAAYTIRHGDTLSGIARQLGVSPSALLQVNPQIRSANLIYPGDVLDVPGGGRGDGAPASAANEPVGTTSTSAPGGKFDYNRIDGVQGNPNVTPAFIGEVEAMAGRLGTKPEYLMAVMSFETGGSFSPGQKNNAGSGATGLIQFMPNTAPELGTTTAALARMSSVEQLQYVEKYFMQRAGAQNGKLSTLEGVYTSVLYGSPKADPGATLWSSGSSAYKWNSGLDRNSDGRITAGEAANAVRARVDGDIDQGGSAIGDRAAPATSSTGGSTPASATANHIVRSGDTLWQIAIDNGVSPGALIGANSQIRNPDLIFPDQKVHLPGVSGTSGPSGASGATATSGPTATSGSPGTGNGDVVQLALGFLGRNAGDLKGSGELPMDSWVPNNVNCANFVTAVLQKAGLINWHDNTVAGTGNRLKADGWKVVPASQARPGDVCILNYGGHVELVASNDSGKVKLIGSNNINADGSQQVSYGNPYGNAWYLTPP